MATLSESYASERSARHAAEALRAAGVPGRDIRLLIGCRLHDIRHEPVGGWAGAVPPDGRVGSFGNVPRARWRAEGGWAGDPDRQRHGSFGDVDLDVIVDYGDRDVHPHVVGENRLRRLLESAALGDAPTDRVVAELHEGHTILLADVAEISPSDARGRLKGLRRRGVSPA